DLAGARGWQHGNLKPGPDWPPADAPQRRPRGPGPRRALPQPAPHSAPRPPGRPRRAGPAGDTAGPVPRPRGATPSTQLRTRRARDRVSAVLSTRCGSPYYGTMLGEDAGAGAGAQLGDVQGAADTFKSCSPNIRVVTFLARGAGSGIPFRRHEAAH